MKTEYEIRVLEINLKTMMKKVEDLGAEKVGIYHQKRYVYDFVPTQKGRWIRLRSNGIESTLAIKEVKDMSISGTRELEISVSDFEDTNAILKKLGYCPRTFQENFRIEYILDGVKLDFDKWPMIPPYLEIEGDSEQAVRKMISTLGLSKDKVFTEDVDTIYRKRYGIELDSIKLLEFSKEEEQLINLFR